MVPTDTPGTAFDKIPIDIVGSLQSTENKNSLILTIQGLHIKYSVAVPLKQASSEIAEALVEKFINPYTAPKAWITDQGLNFISSVMRHKAHI